MPRARKSSPSRVKNKPRISIAPSVQEDLRANSIRLSEALRRVVHSDIATDIDKCFDVLSATVSNRGTIWLCGSGFSYHSALQASARLVGISDGLDVPVRSSVLASCPSQFYTVCDTVGYDQGLSRELFVMGRNVDCLWLFCTGTCGEHLLDLARTAKEDLSIPVITFTNYPGTPLSHFGDAKVRINEEPDNEDRIQETHMLVFNTICQRLKAIAAGVSPDESVAIRGRK